MWIWTVEKTLPFTWKQASFVDVDAIHVFVNPYVAYSMHGSWAGTVEDMLYVYIYVHLYCCCFFKKKQKHIK